MYKYFQEMQKGLKVPVKKEEVVDYKQKLHSELLKLGADDTEIARISDEMVETAIRNKSNPCDFAWAFLQ